MQWTLTASNSRGTHRRCDRHCHAIAGGGDFAGRADRNICTDILKDVNTGRENDTVHPHVQHSRAKRRIFSAQTHYLGVQE